MQKFLAKYPCTSSQVRLFSSLDFSRFSPSSSPSPTKLSNFVNGEWQHTQSYLPIVNPLTGEEMLFMPDTKEAELDPFVHRMASIPKSGLHNPFKNPNRYVEYGEISFKLALELDKPEVSDHFTRCIQAVAPKSYSQAAAEVNIVKIFLQNFSGDQVRFLGRGFTVSGDYLGQQSQGYRWPYGPVALITPFNFPLEIPVLQLMGALYMGNHVTMKCASLVSMVMEEWLRLMLKCGMPKNDVNFIHCGGKVMNTLLKRGQPRSLQFTGSTSVASHLAHLTNGKIKIEDAGFDWKVLGRDAERSKVEYIAWQCDHDAYAHSGQKCSAQSILFAHSRWMDLGLIDRMQAIASERSLSNLTIGPVLSHTTSDILKHVASLLEIEGAQLLFGGKEILGHSIPACYGAVQPTAVFIPLRELVREEYFTLCTTEIFGPFQIVTEWESEEDLQLVLSALERMHAHLTAAVVSNDTLFVQRVLGSTVNGTTYAGLRARTTGAPQNHWFGPAGDPRGAGIGSPEAIQLVWSCHREIIKDEGPLDFDRWQRPPPA